MTQSCPVWREEHRGADTGQGTDCPLQTGDGCTPAASRSACPSLLEPPTPPLSQPGLELLSSTSFFSWQCWQPELLKTSVFGCNQSPCEALAPSFCTSRSSRGKIYYKHHFTQTSRMCWDSTIYEATTWFLLTTQESRKTETSPPDHYQAGQLPEPVTAPL